MSSQVTNQSDVCGSEPQSESGDERLYNFPLMVDEFCIVAEFNKILSSDFDLLPLFERQYNDFICIKKYSMTTNEKLRKRWQDRVRGNPEEVGLRTMPTMSDYHFHNCRIKLLSSHSIANFPTFRRHLAPGPGVDNFGQKPIPDDMQLRKSEEKTGPPSIKTKCKTRARAMEQKGPAKS